MHIPGFLGRPVKNLAASILSLGLMSAAHGAEASSGQLGIGIGFPYGGLGARYTMPLEEGRQLYLGAGLFAYSSELGTWAGFSFGFDQQIMGSRHSLGLGVGTVGAETYSFGKVTYYGLKANYLYHFSGFSQKTGVIGLSAYVGEPDNDHPVVTKRRYGIAVVLGYQF